MRFLLEFYVLKNGSKFTLGVKLFCLFMINVHHLNIHSSSALMM